MKENEDRAEKIPVNFRFPIGLKEKGEKTAAGLGMNLSVFVRECVEIFSEMEDPGLWTSIFTLSKTHNLSRGVVLRNILAAYHGIKWAQRETCGVDDPQIQTEWAKTQTESTLPAEDICYRVKNEYLPIFKAYKDLKKDGLL
jgi:hypothetical protein